MKANSFQASRRRLGAILLGLLLVFSQPGRAQGGANEALAPDSQPAELPPAAVPPAAVPPAATPLAISRLPDMKGYGELPGLRQTMLADPGGRLQTLLERFVEADPRVARTLVRDIILAWAGVEDLGPASRGDYVADARPLYAMEKFWGRPFTSCGGEAACRREADDLRKSFDDWEERVAAYLLLSVHYRRLYGFIGRPCSDDNGESRPAAFCLSAGLRRLYDSGQEDALEEITGFLEALRVYDEKGQAALNELRADYREVKSAAGFPGFMAFYFLEAELNESRTNDY